MVTVKIVLLALEETMMATKLREERLETTTHSQPRSSSHPRALPVLGAWAELLCWVHHVTPTAALGWTLASASFYK